MFDAELARLRAGNILPLHPSLGGDFDASRLLEYSDPWNLIDWTQFWATDHNAEEWLFEPIIAAERGHAMVARGGTGKSLLALWVALTIATRDHDPAHVLYVDYEMTADDLAERLEEMGCGPNTNLDHLHYALLPAIPPLDTDQGGTQLADLAESKGCRLVVIDTYARAVTGDENEADTVRAFYRATAQQLKRRGIALLRIDHLGKDATKGARGSSAKNDDVDIVWQLEAREGGIILLRATKRRTNWVPEIVTLRKIDEPELCYVIVDGAGWPEGTARVAAELDAMNLPNDTSARAATATYRESGGEARNSVIRAAVKYRKQRIEALEDEPEGRAHPSGRALHADTAPPSPGTSNATIETPGQHRAHISGRGGAHGGDAPAPRSGAYKGPPGGKRDPDPNEPLDDNHLFGNPGDHR